MRFDTLMRDHAPPSMKSFVDANWHQIVAIANFLENEDSSLLTPAIDIVMSAYHLVSMDPEGMFPHSLKTVFIFQDPYNQPGYACGVATVTLNGKAQPTLVNIFKRLGETYKNKAIMPSVDNITSVPSPIKVPPLYNGDIRGWCTQGVLLMNTALTTEIGSRDAPHVNDWAPFMKQLLKWISDTFPYIIFVFFGKKAQALAGCISGAKHTVLTTSHPAPQGYDRGFNTCNIFNEINDHLIKHGRVPIQWENYKYV